jgi:RimJ/RimL family protein N-acetyltransferase
MMRVQVATLRDFEHCARNAVADDCELYYEMTGTPWRADDVAAQMWLSGGQRWTYWETVERTPVAVGGYLPLRRGVHGSWFMATPLAWAGGNGITECVARCVRSMFDDESVTRLETTTLATRTRARTWYERIGLHYESTTPKASASGHDLVTYVALRAA